MEKHKPVFHIIKHRFCQIRWWLLLSSICGIALVFEEAAVSAYTSLYPTLGSVIICFGLDGFVSIFRRIWPIYTRR